MFQYSIPILLFILFGFTSCQKNNRIKPEETTRINGETFNETVLIEGHLYDGLIIENCIFENIADDGLQIKDVDDLIIRNCIFRDIQGNAIRFRNSGSSEDVLLENNEIYNIQKNGILVYETHYNTRINKNTIHDVGLETSSSSAGAPHHGIYIQGKNFLVQSNIIYNISNNNGNCISTRSYGIMNNNTLYNATKHGISYYSDHPGESGTLIIQNNMIYDNGSRGVNLNTNGNASNHIGSAIIRFNSIISSSKSCIGVASGMSDVSVGTYGNILVRTDGGSNYINHTDPINSYQNLTSDIDVGFVDYNNRDLHILSSSSAKNFAIGISDFPQIDFDEETRIANQLDAGADEIN